MVPANFPDRNVCILGLGYVGLTLGVEMAASGFRVHGVDIREDIIAALENGKAHFWEDGLQERLSLVLARKTFTFSRRMPDSLASTVFIITVGTPLGADRKARIDMIANATREIASVMPANALVILRSTVRIGTARSVISPILADTGKPFEIAVCPERTLEGRALKELHELPQVIGADAPEAAHRASQLFSCLTPTTVRVNRLESAEVIKLVDNTYRDVFFAFANEVARLCDAVGISANDVIDAGKLGYVRTNVALPGPVGGPCLEKDPHILIESARMFGLDLDMAIAGRRVNERLPSESAAFIGTLARLSSALPRHPHIALLGIAFKGRPATNDLRGTMAVPILRELRTEFPGAQFRAYDPVVAPDEIWKVLNVPSVPSLQDAFVGANIVCILNNHHEFTTMPISLLAKQMGTPGIIYDFWNLFTRKELDMRGDLRYVAIGSHRQSGA